MSAKESRNGREADSIPEGGVLAALPRTRPQRASARRVAARSGAATRAKPTHTTATTKPAREAPATKPGVGEESVARKKPAGTKKPATTKKPAGTTRPVETKKPAAAKKPVETKRRIHKPIPKPAEPPAPKQGYEPEEEVELGATVHPPSGAELVESVADIVGELAGSSFAAGGRLLKDAFSLLRRP
jgi:outer membrane biosynthesis protein TonB